MTQPLKLAQKEQYQAAIDAGYGFLHFLKRNDYKRIGLQRKQSLAQCIPNKRGVSTLDSLQ